MKHLLLIRHAKSDWDVNKYPDFARPLNKRGIKEALDASESLKKLVLKSDIVLCSPSVRTVQTLSLITSKNLTEIPQVKLVPEIYLAGKMMLKNIVDMHQQHDIVCLIGHNDGISDFLSLLLNENHYHFPTCGWALVEIKGVLYKLKDSNF
jgi:phosphohistidine phosphatase